MATLKRLRHIAKSQPYSVVNGVALVIAEPLALHSLQRELGQPRSPTRRPRGSAWVGKKHHMSEEEKRTAVIDVVQVHFRTAPHLGLGADTRYDRYLPWVAKLLAKENKAALKEQRDPPRTENVKNLLRRLAALPEGAVMTARTTGTDPVTGYTVTNVDLMGRVEAEPIAVIAKRMLKAKDYHEYAIDRMRITTNDVSVPFDLDRRTVDQLMEDIAILRKYPPPTARVQNMVTNLRQSFQLLADWARAENVDLMADYDELDVAYMEALDWFREAEEERRIAALQAEVVYEWPDGWTVQRLNTAEELRAEGESMRHCVGDYEPDDLDPVTGLQIFSLRDPDGHPHATMEWASPQATVTQLRGRTNNVPKAEYLSRMFEFRRRGHLGVTGWRFYDKWDPIDQNIPNFLGVVFPPPDYTTQWAHDSETILQLPSQARGLVVFEGGIYPLQQVLDDLRMLLEHAEGEFSGSRGALNAIKARRMQVLKNYDPSDGADPIQSSDESVATLAPRAAFATFLVTGTLPEVDQPEDELADWLTSMPEREKLALPHQRPIVANRKLRIDEGIVVPWEPPKRTARGRTRGGPSGPKQRLHPQGTCVGRWCRSVTRGAGRNPGPRCAR
jgi:hypothetical protein